MIGLVANILLNTLLVGLLTATIIYCYILNRRIQVLQDSKSELAALLAQFDESTVKASETIVAMQTASKKIGENIQLKLDKANYLLDDLSFTIEKGTRLTSQIEASFAINRARNQAGHDIHDANDHTLHVAPDEPEHYAEKPAAKQAAPKRTPASIEALLEKVVSRKQQAQEPAVSPKEPATASRSRAEQELIELIRSSSKG